MTPGERRAPARVQGTLVAPAIAYDLQGSGSPTMGRPRCEPETPEAASTDAVAQSTDLARLETAGIGQLEPRDDQIGPWLLRRRSGGPQPAVVLR